MDGRSRPACQDRAALLLETAPADGLRGPNLTESSMGLNRPSRTAVTLSPDGQTLVFNGIQGERRQLFRRRLSDATEAAVPMDGTEGAECPFISPDGAWVGFWARGAIWKVPVDEGGFPVRLREYAFRPAGASWSRNNHIAVAPQDEVEGVTVFRASDGASVAVLRPDVAKGEWGRYTLPHFLPGGDVLLVSHVKQWGYADEASTVLAVSVTGSRLPLVEGAADARYLPTGHLAYVTAGRLEAVAFDPESLKVTGEAFPLLPDVMQAMNSGSTFIDTGAAQVAISDRTGTLVYLPGGFIPDRRSRLVWVDRRGEVVGTLLRGGRVEGRRGGVQEGPSVAVPFG